MRHTRMPAVRLNAVSLFFRSKLTLRASFCVLSFSFPAMATAATAGLQPPPAGHLPALPDAPEPQTQATNLRSIPRDILRDQAVIWTSPARIRPHDLVWLLPLGAATGVAIATDQRAMRDVVSNDASFNNANINTSNALLGGLVAAPVAIYGFGFFEDHPHAREAGILTGEAMVDGVVVEEGMKLIFWRERPMVDNDRGRFFQSSVGGDSSFPSTHSVIAWSAAATMAGEFPSRWTQAAVYSAATGVSLTRVLGQQHFPSDVLVGSAAGWLIGHYVAHRHRARYHRVH
jgi:membrane-associated phospholipid phosphatase